MDDSPTTPAERVLDHLKRDERDAAVAALERLATAAADERKTATRSLRDRAEDDPTSLRPVSPALAPFLVDEKRAVRLTTAKLFATLAAADPEAVLPVVPSLVDRLGDDDEFYYVRARCAEALGYAALDNPGAVASPETLAELRVGLSFDEPEVREKLAKALELVALGDPDRLRHHVSTLVDHLDDDTDLVRYHLATALVVVGIGHPEGLADERDALAARLDDGNAYVRGRAAEALGVLARPDDGSGGSLPVSDLESLAGGDDQFVTERARFALEAGGVAGHTGDEASSHEEVGTIDAIRERTDDIAEDIATPETDGECPQCGLELPTGGPPMCPQCGAPR